MTIRVEIDDFETIAENSWNGAKYVCNEIIRQGREKEAMRLIEETFMDMTPSETELNDFIWYDLGELMCLWDTEENEDDEEEDEE